MKKSVFNRIWITGLVISFLTLSCTNLDEELYSAVTADNFFKTDEEFIAALGQAYSSFQGLGNHGNLWSSNEIASDELVITTKGGDWYDGGVLLQLHQHEYTPDNSFFNNMWGQCYGGVNTANRLIYTFEQLGTPEADAFISELRAIRALWYYWLVDAFGNVPLVVDFTDTKPPANASRLTVYNFIESELNDIMDELPTAKDASTYGRMTRWAALAIRCKLYLNAEVYTGTVQWAKAAADAEEIIDDGPFSLEGNYASNFAIANQGSRENILVYPYDKVFAQGFNWPMMTLHYASQGVFNFNSQPWNGYATLEEFYNSYIDPVKNPGPQGDVWNGKALAPAVGTQDERLTNFVVGPQFNQDGTRAIDPAAEAIDPDGAPLTFTPEINEIYPNSWRQGGARIGKYEYEQGGTPNMSNDFVILRLADIILSLAEAKFRLGQTGEALVLVNSIRDRASVDPFPALTAEILLAERGREMFVEMTRRQDLIRFGKYGDPWWEKEASADYLKLFPIPKQQRDANSKLAQNPGYPGAGG
ncbi:MAG: RagB/SusD family nutrient uptake outer membrane protein [Cyclobacteriaceae bacterium]